MEHRGLGISSELGRELNEIWHHPQLDLCALGAGIGKERYLRMRNHSGLAEPAKPSIALYSGEPLKPS